MTMQEAGPRPQSGYGQSAACSPASSFTGPMPPQPHSAYFSGMTGPQHPFYNRPYFPHHVYDLPRHYPHHAPSSMRSFIKPPSQPKENTNGLAFGAALLSSMTTDTVCERLKQMDGIDHNMLAQYTVTIKKANINGRVLSQCNLDELKKEMEMNFGDWQLFRGMVMEQRHVESQALLQDESRAPSEQGSSIQPTESRRRSGVAPHESFGLNLSFEELSGVGLEEPPRPSNSSHWPVVNLRTSSMSSLNSQESSNDICKLTDKQQAEYRDAYREYIAQMAQLEMSGNGGDRPVQPHPGQFLQAAGSDDKGAKEGADQDSRKSFTKRGSKSDATDFPSGSDAQLLDPISEEDEKLDHSTSSRILGSRKTYQKLPNDDDSSPEDADNTTPLLQKEERAQSSSKPGMMTEMQDQKDSSDSGMRSSDSASDRSLEEAEGEAEGAKEPGKPSFMELELDGLVKKRGLLPTSLSGLQDMTVTRMSICSEAPSEVSLMASSPDEAWPPGNLNRNIFNDNSADDPGTNSNTNNSHKQPTGVLESSTAAVPSALIITPGSSTTTATVHHNQNLRTISLGDERESVL
ncbi:kinase D-interacting substrate of 220 kDa B-like [Neosynchiropus ocellatus]